MPAVPEIYAEAWRTLGLVTAQDVSDDEAEFARGEDPHPEHYRWRRFVKFIHERSVIDGQLARSLFILGSKDSDRALGESMMSVIIRREDCPAELYEMALQSGSDHLKRVAIARLSEKKG